MVLAARARSPRLGLVDEASLPPIFNRCTDLLSVNDEVASRDPLDWQAVSLGGVSPSDERRSDPTRSLGQLDALAEAARRNPFVAAPHVVHAQICLQLERWEEAEAAARRGVELLCDVGHAVGQADAFQCVAQLEPVPRAADVYTRVAHDSRWHREPRRPPCRGCASASSTTTSVDVEILTLNPVHERLRFGCIISVIDVTAATSSVDRSRGPSHAMRPCCHGRVRPYAEARRVANVGQRTNVRKCRSSSWALRSASAGGDLDHVDLDSRPRTTTSATSVGRAPLPDTRQLAVSMASATSSKLNSRARMVPASLVRARTCSRCARANRHLLEAPRTDTGHFRAALGRAPAPMCLDVALGRRISISKQRFRNRWSDRLAGAGTTRCEGIGIHRSCTSPWGSAPRRAGLFSSSNRSDPPTIFDIHPKSFIFSINSCHPRKRQARSMCRHASHRHATAGRRANAHICPAYRIIDLI